MKPSLNVRTPPAVDADPYSDETLENPHEMYRAVREAGPVAYLTLYDVLVMGRHRDISPALKDWETFSSAGGSGLADIRKPGAWRAPSPIVESDPPDHTRVRNAMQKVLSPVLIRQWREDFISEAERLVGELVERGEFDGVADLAEAFTAKMLPDALGLRWTPERRENLFMLGALNFDGQGPRNARYEASQSKADGIADWYEASMKREALLPNGFGDRLYQAADRGELDPSLAPLLVRSFLRGGLDSTSSAISAALWYLAQDPGQWVLLRADPTKARAAFEEAMRLETPIQNVCRQTTRPLEIDGVHVEEDRKILILLGSANRDPDFWERPDEYDLTRSTLGHLALGNGIHACVGQMIARLEGEAVLTAAARLIDKIEMVGEPTRRLNNNLRALNTLPLRVTAA
jgi:cytochrome P450